MKTIKTYEILKMIDDNPKEMIGKRFKQVGGLVGEDFGIGDIAVVTEYFSITSLGGEKFNRIRLTLNGFEEWEEVKESVDFMTAFNSWWSENKTISYELDGGKYTIGTKSNVKFYPREIKYAKWFIED